MAAWMVIKSPDPSFATTRSYAYNCEVISINDKKDNSSFRVELFIWRFYVMNYYQHLISTHFIKQLLQAHRQQLAGANKSINFYFVIIRKFIYEV
jgi:hypothetical protein